jgi:hypothetical protein
MFPSTGFNCFKNALCPNFYFSTRSSFTLTYQELVKETFCFPWVLPFFKRANTSVLVIRENLYEKIQNATLPPLWQLYNH